MAESRRVILVTPTAAKLKGFPHWIQLSHLKLFTLPAQDDPSYTVTQTGPCSLRFQRTPSSASLTPVQKNKGPILIQLSCANILSLLLFFLYTTSPYTSNVMLKFPINHSAVITETIIKHRTGGTRLSKAQVVRNNNKFVAPNSKKKKLTKQTLTKQIYHWLQQCLLDVKVMPWCKKITSGKKLKSLIIIPFNNFLLLPPPTIFHSLL